MMRVKARVILTVRIYKVSLDYSLSGNLQILKHYRQTWLLCPSTEENYFQITKFSSKTGYNISNIYYDSINSYCSCIFLWCMWLRTHDFEIIRSKILPWVI